MDKFSKDESNIKDGKMKSDKTNDKTSTMNLRIKDLDTNKKVETKQEGLKRAATLNKVGMKRQGLVIDAEEKEISLNQIMTQCASIFDITMLRLGSLFAIIFGGSFPAFCYFFGNLIDELGISTSQFNY